MNTPPALEAEEAYIPAPRPTQIVSAMHALANRATKAGAVLGHLLPGLDAEGIRHFDTYAPMLISHTFRLGDVQGTPCIWCEKRFAGSLQLATIDHVDDAIAGWLQFTGTAA